MSDDEVITTKDKSNQTNLMRKVAFAEIALQRLRSRLPGSRSFIRRDELSISITDAEESEPEQTGTRGTVREIARTSESTVIDSDVLGSNSIRRQPGPNLVKEKRAAIAHAPEQAITLFAFRLALLEKAARGAGALTFVWATVVLLGGFSSYISSADFWVVTGLLLTEGSRIFLLSNELEWQQASSRTSFSLYEFGSSLAHKSNRVIHASPGSSSGEERPAGHRRGHGSPPSHLGSPEVPMAAQQSNNVAPRLVSNHVHRVAPGLVSKNVQRVAPRSVSNRAQRTWSAAVLPLIPYTQIVSARGMATITYIGELLSASLCFVLSIWRLVEHDFIDRDASITSNVRKNVLRSLYAFYVMALLEAFIFLVEKTYWEYKISYERLFTKVDKKAGLKGECIDTMRSFFYKVYSTSLAFSVFTGLEMELVSYSMELLQSDDANEVLGGTRILKTLVEHDSEDDTLRRIGMKSVAIDRLVEMLAWHHEDEKGIRFNSAAIVMALVSSTQNGSRIIAVSGSLENIMSLIKSDEVDGPHHAEGTIAESVPTLRNYGLGILTSLAQDHANCRRIGETRGLLAKLVDIIDNRRQANNTAAVYTTIHQSLTLLNVLASTTGTSGSILRPAIVNVVSAIPHLRDILHCEATDLSKEFHETAVDVLKHLALDKHSREVIGSTGGVISNLMLLFTRRSLQQMPYQHRYSSHDDASNTEEEELRLAQRAGEVLVRLALQSKENCDRILRTRFPDPISSACKVLLRILRNEENKELSIHAAGILRNSYTHMSTSMQAEVSKQSEFFLKRAITCASGRVREAALGMTKALRGLSDNEFAALFESQRVDRSALVDCLMECLNHAPSSTRRPKIRRYALELILILLNRDEQFKLAFGSKDLPSTLVVMLVNISDVENYLLFSGGMGLTRHKGDMESLVLKVAALFDR